MFQWTDIGALNYWNCCKSEAELLTLELERRAIVTNINSSLSDREDW